MFRRLFLLFVILSLTACAPTRQTASLPNPTSTVTSQPAPLPNPTSTVTSQPAPQPTKPALELGEQSNTYWITNPTSQAQLFVQVQYPDNWSGQALPTLVLVPGGTAAGDPQKARQLVDQGFIAIVFDADGRGHSQGNEDMNGYIQQDGLAAIIRAVPAMPGVDSDNIGLVSYSYGITMASGALARYPDLPVKFLIDWEGPANRFDTTVGCKPNPRNQWPDCADEAAWAQREAETFISQIRVPYQRVQSEIDHVQPDVSNAIDMINAAAQGGVPWVRLNDYPANQTYDINNPPAMIPESQAKRIDAKIAQYAQELFAQ